MWGRETTARAETGYEWKGGMIWRASADLVRNRSPGSVNKTDLYQGVERAYITQISGMSRKSNPDPRKI